jgi:hypothetical protein
MPNRITFIVFLIILMVPAALAQDAFAPPSPQTSASADSQVPRYIRFNGVVRVEQGQPPRAGIAGITFALYAEQEGGAPLWFEVQNVRLDAQGRYSVLLGANSRDGLPLELFASTEARWLGVQVEGQAEQPRVMLLSVPYALKAAEADKLAGRSASDFVLHEALSAQVRQEVEAVSAAAPEKAMTTTPTGTLAVTASGTVGRIAKFTGVDALGDSTISESGTNVGVGTPSSPNRFAINSTTAILPSTAQISHPGGDWGLVFKRTANDGGHPNFTFVKSRGETALPAQSGDGMGRIVWQAVNAAGPPTAVYAGEISMYATTVSGANVASDMRFYTKPLTGGLTERMRISPDGNVGVGSAAPPNRFAINATTAVLPSTMQISHPGGDWGLVFKRNANDSGHPNFTFLKTRGEGAVPAQAGDGVGRIVWQAVNGSSSPIYVGEISMYANAVTASDVSSDLRFATRSTTIGLAERMRITPEGRVGIGTPLPATLLDVAGTAKASAFVGNGAGLTGVNAADLACSGCVTESELAFDPATQTELATHAASGDHDGRYLQTIAPGTGMSVGSSFANTTSLSIPDSGAGSPYPSTITIAGLAGTVTRVIVTIVGFSHTWPADVDMMLVGPTGAYAVIFSDAGGGTDAVALDITLDDAAPSALPYSPLSSGTFQPANWDLELDPFDTPAPVTLSGTAGFAPFLGTDPNGVWSLYVTDDASSDTGSLAGWKIHVETSAGSSNTSVAVGIAGGGIGTSQLADNAVTGIKLTDGAITAAKIADTAVTEAKLAFDPATQA